MVDFERRGHQAEGKLILLLRLLFFQLSFLLPAADSLLAAQCPTCMKPFKSKRSLITEGRDGEEARAEPTMSEAMEELEAANRGERSLEEEDEDGESSGVESEEETNDNDNEGEGGDEDEDADAQGNIKDEARREEGGEQHPLVRADAAAEGAEAASEAAPGAAAAAGEWCEAAAKKQRTDG